MYELSSADESRINNEITKLGDELKQLQDQGKITKAEKSKQINELYEKLCKEATQKKKGAFPKKKSESPKKSADSSKQTLLLNKEEKLIYKQLNSNKLNCTNCRKLIARLINEKTRYHGAEEAGKHLNSRHGIKIANLTAKLLAPPTASDTEMTWDNSEQTTSLYQLTTTSQDEINKTSFPLLPPVSSVMLEDEISTHSIEKPAKKTSTSNIDKDGFQIPKSTNKRKITPPSEEISTRNKYQLLTDSENTDSPVYFTENEENTTLKSKSKATPTKTTSNPTRPNTRITRIIKEKPPPPLIIQGSHGRNNFNKLQGQLKTDLSNGYTIKYSKNNILIYAKDIMQYKELKLKLSQDKIIEWHTYALEEEKTHAFVLKGLDNEPDINEIEYELKENYKLEVKRIYPMQTKYRLLYLIITSAKTTLKDLKNIKYVNHVEVSWELRRKFTEISQCKKCCRWGHSATYCSRTRRCPNCSETHPMEDQPCNKSAKCANCGGEHPATDLSCSTYKYRIERLKEAQKTGDNKKPTVYYNEAAPPKENIWKTRRKMYEQQIRKTNTTEHYTTDDESTEAEAAAFPRRSTTKTTRRTTTSQQCKENQGHLSKGNSGENISELLELSREYKSLGNSFCEAIRFLKDFLTIFKKTKQEDRAFALLNIMLEINNYKF